MAAAYKLYYLNYRARAEPIRLILSYAGVPFDDIRLTFEEWKIMKPNNTPFGHLPVLEFDGKMLAESWTICRYLAKKYDLVGSNDWESAQAEMYVDVINDLRLAVLPAIRENDATKKAQLYDQAVNEKVLPHLRLVEKHLENNGGSYLIGESFTWADLAHFNFLSVGEMVDQFPDLLKETPLLKQLIERLADVPNVKHWLETRPKTVY